MKYFAIKSRKIIWLVCYFSIISYNVSAQKSWTLSECLAYAQRNNFDVQQAELNQNRAIVQLKNTKNIFLPTVDVRVRTAGNWGFIIDPSTNELSNLFNFGN